MSVPLDRLYNFLHDLCNHDIIIYRFYPHGSRKIKDCTLLADVQKHSDLFTHMTMVCHDQEPLNPEMFYSPLDNFHIPNVPFSPLRDITGHYGLYDENLLLHSEKNSTALKWFEDRGTIGVYYWSHALIARDWYRYAAIDPKLAVPAPTPQYDFLVYNRAWAGTREYRLQFTELVSDAQLDQCSLMKFSPVCDDVDYREHIFKNPQFQIKADNLEQVFQQNVAPAASSADYELTDYQQCRIEVVLETLFDDTRQHLTEKIFRPMACKKPFILAATPGSLEYIRSYGFKTFGEYIDESYDTIQDPAQRLLAIVALMKQLASLGPEEKQELYQNLDKICKHNYDHFFSDTFFNSVVCEFQDNLQQGVEAMAQHRTGAYFRRIIKIVGSTRRLPERFTRDLLATMWTQLHRWGTH